VVLAASDHHENKTTSMNGILEQLENLGHEGVPYIEGLNVKLLEFQRQALKWALEREAVAGGIQGYWWAKLPTSGCPTQDIYIHPILGAFRKVNRASYEVF
jgi:hypothetical protein